MQENRVEQGEGLLAGVNSQCLSEGNPEFAHICVDSPFDWTEDIQNVIHNAEFYI